jgi:hypothetical protein
VILAAARRFAVLITAVGLGGIALGSVFAVATGSSVRRGAALGLYSVGALCIVMGVGVAFRNSLQRSTGGAASAEPTETAVVDRELAGILIVLGLLLLVVGVAVDTRAELV